MKTVAVIAALAAGQAQALSCLPPDPVSSFVAANESDLPYLVLQGDLILPDDATTTGEAMQVTARLQGLGLSHDGFTAAFDDTVVLDVTCGGPWCGGLPDDGPVLAFARVDGPVPVIEMNACNTWTFAAQDQAVLDQLTACLNGAGCQAL